MQLCLFEQHRECCFVTSSYKAVRLQVLAEVTLIWKPDPTLASTFYLCPLDNCNRAAPILIENHLGRAHEAIVKMALNSTAFGQRSSFRMRGFFERTVGIAVVSLSHLLVTVGDHTEDGLHTVFRRAQIFQESDGSQRQTQEINFHLAANWRLFHLKASGATRLGKKSFTTPMGRWIFPATLSSYFELISLV